MAKKNGKVGKAGKNGVVTGGQKMPRKNAASKEASLSTLIDPFLVAGKHTIKGIAGELAKKGGELAKGRDLAANVRARMVSYTRKGWQIIKDDENRVKLLQKKG